MYNFYVREVTLPNYSLYIVLGYYQIIAYWLTA